MTKNVSKLNHNVQRYGKSQQLLYRKEKTDFVSCVFKDGRDLPFFTQQAQESSESEGVNRVVEEFRIMRERCQTEERLGQGRQQDSVGQKYNC